MDTSKVSLAGRTESELVAVAVAVLTVGTANAQDYPGTKPVTFVVPFAAGGPTDRVARDLAEAMRKTMPGGNFTVENAAGAGGSDGTQNTDGQARPDQRSRIALSARAWCSMGNKLLSAGTNMRRD